MFERNEKMKEDGCLDTDREDQKSNIIDEYKDLDRLCKEIRDKIISVVSNNGGHLASNLGVVELSVALHKVFSGDNDRIVWDVGHQSYVHKILTDRLDKIDTIRTEGGLSGFTNREESPYDIFTSGHSSTSISASFGFACANDIQNKEGHTIAVIGDGALTGGLAYEGLNNAGKFKKNFVVVLNDNKMSISSNVGAISSHLTYIRIRPSYMRMKGRLEHALRNIPIVGMTLTKIIRRIKYVFKSVLYNTTIFEDMGFLYYGPVDGHDIDRLVKVFNLVKTINRPVLVHVVTTKGKGYKFAEDDPKQFHGLSGFNAQTGCVSNPKKSFSKVFGDKLCEIAEKNDKVCAVTAAMISGTGLSEFSRKYKNRLFDVGIAEEHAVTFAGGLAAGGMTPVIAVYSSFLQRGYDQIIHDIAIQRLKVIFAIDRAGLIGEDGETHQGIFDVPFLNSIPNIRILAPSFFDEMEYMLENEILNKGSAVAIRYPKGSELYRPSGFKYKGDKFNILGDINSEIIIITYGRLFSNVCLAKELILSKYKLNICIIKLNIIKPIDQDAIKIALGFKKVFFFEESEKSGGIGETFGSELAENGFKGSYSNMAINNLFVKHASLDSQFKKFFFDPKGITQKIIMEND